MRFLDLLSAMLRAKIGDRYEKCNKRGMKIDVVQYSSELKKGYPEIVFAHYVIINTSEIKLQYEIRCEQSTGWEVDEEVA